MLCSLFTAVLMISAADVPASEIKSDEEVIFFPTAAALDADRGVWQVPVHGVVFEPEIASWRREAALRLLGNWLPENLGEEERAILDRRVRLLLVDHERNKSIWIRLGDRAYSAGSSGPDGHFSTTMELPKDTGRPCDWLDFRAITRAGDDRRFAGRAALLPPEGLSVISDIDDTIKISNVRDRRELMANTFLRPFRPVPGMADFYKRLAERGAAFHYVSASPWLLYPALAEFRAEAGFPEGTFDLKLVRLTDSSVRDLFGSQVEYKRGKINAILERFPKRRFVLIGDTGEQDPEVYGALARERSKQIVAIYLRNVTDETARGPRLTAAMKDIPADRWQLFTDPATCVLHGN